MVRGFEPCGPVVLAHEPRFQLGALAIDPSRLSVARGGQILHLEARVMQVLVLLAQADGQVVSRAELVERCWVGTIVGENAIQRVISRLRHLAATLGGFAIETVPKVGYLLRLDLIDEPCVSPNRASPTALEPQPVLLPKPVETGVNRRRVTWASGAIVVAGAAGLALPLTASPNPDAEEAQRLVLKAQEAELTGQREANSQAIAYLKRATELDTRSAVAWGELALAYQGRMEQSDENALPALADWVRSAAARALAIDPAIGSAHLALATIAPNFRHWASKERVLRQMERARQPHPAIDGALGSVMCDTGRWQEAIAHYRRALALQPYHPMNRLVLSMALWGGGELDEADRLLENAIRLWPNNLFIWHSRFQFLALTGRAEAAVALVDDNSARPVVSADEATPPYAALRDFALAVQAVQPAEAGKVADRLVKLRGELGTSSVVTYLCVLGRIDDAFPLLHAYYFGSDSRPPPGPLGRRKTSFLFAAKTASMRTDERYTQLLQRVGLQSYWRETGTRSDPRPMTAARL